MFAGHLLCLKYHLNLQNCFPCKNPTIIPMQCNSYIILVLVSFIQLRLTKFAHSKFSWEVPWNQHSTK